MKKGFWYNTKIDIFDIEENIEIEFSPSWEIAAKEIEEQQVFFSLQEKADKMSAALAEAMRKNNESAFKELIRSDEYRFLSNNDMLRTVEHAIYDDFESKWAAIAFKERRGNHDKIV